MKQRASPQIEFEIELPSGVSLWCLPVFVQEAQTKLNNFQQINIAL